MGVIANDKDPLYQKQIEREKAQRDAALGRRAKAIASGEYGPVLKRWLGSSIEPTAKRLTSALKAYLAEDFDTFTALSSSPLFGLAQATQERSRNISVIYRWIVAKPSRAEDMVLGCLGTILEYVLNSELSDKARGKPLGMAGLLSRGADCMREIGIGQFIDSFQGSKAVQKVRRMKGQRWEQWNKLNQTAALFRSQVKPQVDSEGRGEVTLERLTGGRSAIWVADPINPAAGGKRLLTIKADKITVDDWMFLELARKDPEKGADGSKDAWANLALLVVCIAQAEMGWFDIYEKKSAKNARNAKRARTKYLTISTEALEAIAGSLDGWSRAGFELEPMIVPPSDETGGYLTVKHRSVSGIRGPMGLQTKCEGTNQWVAIRNAMGKTAWSVNEYALEYAKDQAKRIGSNLAPRDRVVMGAYARHAEFPEFYLPVYMDFRGRAYYRSTWITPQGSDLQKGLLCFPEVGSMSGKCPEEMEKHIAMHAAALYGGSEKLDKASFERRWEWWKRWAKSHLAADTLIGGADSPIQLYGLLKLWQAGQWDRIPLQIDGTCNGLQHLSALFQDRGGAQWVNLRRTAGDNTAPEDLYGKVAEIVQRKLMEMRQRDLDTPEKMDWVLRVMENITIDRALCKKAVMVLPYGGSLQTIQESVKQAALEQYPSQLVWVEAGGEEYRAHRERALEDHPLFRKDMEALGKLVYDSIGAVIPKAMEAMAALRGIAQKVGKGNYLGWCVGPDPERDLHIIHAYPQSASTRINVQGFHLPESIRGLKLRRGKDEVDTAKHVNGIVANFIHSLDAAHLARTAGRAWGSYSFGAIHDCYVTRPSGMTKLKTDTRRSFAALYAEDPLSFRAYIANAKTGKIVVEGSWYDLADYAGVKLPERGDFNIYEVLDSEWFFS